MTYCHVSNQLAWHANKPEPKTFGDLGEWEQEYIVTELSESVLSDKASLKWVDYTHVIDADFAMQSLLEEADFIEELAKSVLQTSSAKTLLLNQLKAETKGLIKCALDKCNMPPNGYDFEEILGSYAA